MTERGPLSDVVVEKALQGKVHHRFIDIEKPWDTCARKLIRALAAEIVRLRDAHGEEMRREGAAQPQAPQARSAGPDRRGSPRSPATGTNT